MEILSIPYAELTTDELYRILQLRSEVFLLEQRIICQDMDEVDQKAIHVCLKIDGRTEGYVRIFEKEGVTYMGRVLIARNLRAKGYGKALMDAAVRTAKVAFPAQPIRLHSQEQAVGFYEKTGFRKSSARFMEEGIPHFEMEYTVTE